MNVESHIIVKITNTNEVISVALVHKQIQAMNKTAKNKRMKVNMMCRCVTVNT